MNVNFNKGDRICFFGDSITKNGGWIAEVFEYFTNNFPQKKIGMYNCGIGGSKGFQFDLKNRLYCDCLNFFPTHVVIMFGMNDIFCWLYNPNHPDYNSPDLREKQIRLYEDALEQMIKIFVSKDIVPIICSPTPYDQYSADLCEDNNFCDCGLETCAKIAEEKAKKYNLMYIDMRSALLDRLSMNPINDDRTHPNDIGNHLMAERFLYAIGAKDKEEPEKQVILSEKNIARKKVEERLRTIMGVERDHFGMQFEPSKPISERKEIVCGALDKGEFLFCKTYPDDADYRDELTGELIRLTYEMYE